MIIREKLLWDVFHAAGFCRSLGVPCPACVADIERKARRIVQDAVTEMYAEEAERRQLGGLELGGEA